MKLLLALLVGCAPPIEDAPSDVPETDSDGDRELEDDPLDSDSVKPAPSCVVVSSESVDRSLGSADWRLASLDGLPADPLACETACFALTSTSTCFGIASEVVCDDDDQGAVRVRCRVDWCAPCPP